LVTGLVGCGSSSVTENKYDNMSPEQIKAIIMSVNDDYSVNIQELETLISNNIDGLTQEEKNLVLENYLLSTMMEVDGFNNKLSVLGYELESVVNEHKIDVLNPVMYDLIPNTNATVKGLLIEIHTEGFLLRYDNVAQMYFVELNLDTFIKKFDKHLTNSFRTYLEFNQHENTNNALVNEHGISLEEVLSRLSAIEEGIVVDEEEDYAFADKWSASKEYYLYALLGLNHGYFYSEDGEEYTDEYLDEIKDIDLDVVKSAIDIIVLNNKNIDDSYEDLMNLIKDEVYTSEVIKSIMNKYPETKEMFESIFDELVIDGEVVIELNEENAGTLDSLGITNSGASYDIVEDEELQEEVIEVEVEDMVDDSEDEDSE
ncbi:MAG: hypothetical protein R3Y64_11215, partial [Peptostreptococcaceae bacterium]